MNIYGIHEIITNCKNIECSLFDGIPLGKRGKIRGYTVWKSISGERGGV